MPESCVCTAAPVTSYARTPVGPWAATSSAGANTPCLQKT